VGRETDLSLFCHPLSFSVLHATETNFIANYVPDVDIQEIRALIVSRSFQLIEFLKFVTKLSHLSLQEEIIYPALRYVILRLYIDVSSTSILSSRQIP
jgi:hypothetical protein